MGIIFVYDKNVVLYVSNDLWEECKVTISTACISYLLQNERITNIDEDIERLGFNSLNTNELSSAHLFFLSKHITELTSCGLIGVYHLLDIKSQYSFTDCKNISSSIHVLLPKIISLNHIACTNVLLETILKFKNMIDSNINKTNIYIY